MAVLSPYYARAALARLQLSASLREHAEKLLALADSGHRAQVARIHAELFPLSTAASANAALNRLQRTLNDAASAQGIDLRLEITADKKGGAEKRWVWFAGPPPGPALAATSELNAIPPAQLVTDQRGIPAGDLPLVVLITCNDNETAAVICRFHGATPPPTETRDGMSYYLLGEHGGMRVVLRVSAQGEGEAQNAAYDAIAAWKPQAIIAVGIAFGVNPQKQAIGDVLVAENVRGYELGRQEPNGTFTLRSNKPPTSPALQQRFRHLDQGKQADANACRTWLKLRFGTLLSGNKLVDNRDYLDDLLRIEPEAIGGEMEAVGIQLAADRHKTDWIIVKAICDWGDGNKHGPHKEHDQRVAAERAAYVVHSALSLGSLYAPLSTTPASQSTSPARHAACLPPARSMGLRDYSAIDAERLIADALGRHTSMEKDAVAAADEQGSDVDAMDFVLRWVDERESPPLFALLGEYGMGKTVTCQRLAHVLDQRRMRDTTLPLPLYFDLRNVTGLDRRVPTLGEIVEECIARGWDSPESGETYRYADFERWLDAGAVVIFDGLDEALNRLTEADGQTFTRELLRPLTRQHEAGRARGTFKRLISCRTQFFRTLREQQNHFTGQERGEQRAAAYRALVLLPLDEEQVQHYLAAALPGSDVEQLLATVRSVHNLSELAQRPYTLRLVAEFIPEIEHERLAGKKVYGVTLYRRLVRRWLERDGGKHHLRPEHKLLLARHLAAYLWQSGDGGLPAEQIERWFHAWLAGQPDLQRRYARLHPDQLEEDLRNATFLARIDGSGGSVFRFAHTSLLEFFLADYLFAAIADDDRQRWAIRRPSDETLAFLGQMLAEAIDTTQPALLATLHAWRSSYLPQTSELLLAYALRAHEHGWPAPSLRGAVLAGAPLDGWRFVSPGAGATLDLGGADFSGASLRRAVFDRVCLTGARFVGCQLAQANFLNCDANGSDWSAAECTATIWRATLLNGAQWRAAHGYRPEFLLCDVTPTADSGAAFEQAQIAPFPAATAFPLREANASRASYALSYLRGHVGGIWACAWSPDGARLLSGGSDGTLRVWDARSGAEDLTLHGHAGGVRACAWSPDGARLLSGGDDGTLRVWDARSGAERLTLRGHAGGVRACAWSPDGARLLSGGFDGTLRVWDALSGAERLTLRGHAEWVTTCAWSPDGQCLLSGGFDGTLRVWDVRSGAERLTLRGHAQWVATCAWSPDGQCLLSGGFDGTLRVWDVPSGTERLTLRGHAEWVTACAWSPDGKRLLSGGSGGTLLVRDARSGAERLTLRGHAGLVSACAWSPDGTRLLSGGGDGTLSVWDARGGAEDLTLRGHAGGVRACAWSPDGARLLSGGDDGTLRVWDARGGAERLTLRGHAGVVLACAWSPDGARLLSGGADGTLRVWDARGGAELLTLGGHAGWVSACAWSPDGTRLLSGGSDGTLRVWDAYSGAERLTLRSLAERVSACVWSPDGTRLLSGGSDGTLRVWDAPGGAERLTLRRHAGRVSACAWSPDGARLLSGGDDGTLRVWDASGGAEYLTLRGHANWVWACAWSPDGARLLSGGADGTLRVWDARGGAELLTLGGHARWVRACAWSPDGQRLLSGGDDGTLRIWDAESGELLRIHAVAAAGSEGHAVWEPRDNRLIEASGDAWRWLARVRRGEDGWPERLPLESFGPLPAPQRLRHAPAS